METQTTESKEDTGFATKDSPLTDITTSPPAFDLSSEKLDLLKPAGGPLTAASSVSSSSSDSTAHKASYSSSELSDLGEEDSEAETDKMDFLDDDGNTSTEGVGTLDLNALSKLTELARLKEVDSDSDDGNIDKTIASKSLPDEDDDTATAVSEMVESEGKVVVEGTTKEEDHQQDIISDENGPSIEDKSGNVSDINPPSSKRSLEDSEMGNDSKRTKVESQTHSPSDSTLADVKEDVDVIKADEDTTEEGNNGSISNGNAIDKLDGSPEADNESSHEETEVQENDPQSQVEKKEGSTEAKSVTPVDTELELPVPEVTIEQASESKEEEEDEEESQLKYEQDEAKAEAEADHDNDEIDINEQRRLAIKELFEIEQSFAELRDKLFQDKLTLLEHELQLCLEGSHPELSKIYYKVNEFYQDSLKLANANLTYSLRCIDKETIATRTGVHQNFLRQLMDSRNELITDTTSLWYKINKERNQYDQLVPDFTYSAIPIVPKHAIPDETTGELTPMFVNEERLAVGLEPNAVPLTKKVIKQNTLVELVKQRNDVNQQLGIINGLKQFYGMPVAVGTSLNDETTVLDDELLLKRASEEEINEDLIAMGISI